MPAAVPETLELAPERLVLKVGTFECDLDARGSGKVLLDGQPLAVTDLIVTVRPGREAARVRLEVVPLARPAAKED